MKKTAQSELPSFETVKEIVLYGGRNGKDKKQFVYTAPDGELVVKTFNQVFYDTTGLGQYLYKIGMRGKKVAILSENSYTWIACYYAVITGKMTVIPIDPKLPYADIADIMVRSECDGLFYSDEFSDAVDVIKKTDGVVLTEYIRMDDKDNIVAQGHADLESGSKDYLDDEVLPDDVAFIVYTSGTTGKSKGVMLTQKNVATNVCSSCKTMEACNGHAIGFLPLHHCFSWVGAVFSSPLLIQWGYICSSIKEIQSAMVSQHPQNFSAVPLAVETIYKKIWFTAKKTGREDILKKGLKISRFLMKLGIDRRRKIFKQIIDNLGGELEYIISGGAYLDEKYERGMYDFGIRIINGYGITECSPAVTCCRLDNWKFGSAGQAIPCNEVKINDPDEDGVGEIYVRGTNVMKGYYNDPQATAEVFDGEWFKTGDLGRMDDEGFLFFIGRKKNLIVLSNGENISPEEIEDKLSTIPYVKEVIVSEEDGRLTAEFFLDTIETPDAKDRIKADVNEKNKEMPMYKQIAKVKTRDTEFPKTTTLKILRAYNRK